MPDIQTALKEAIAHWEDVPIPASKPAPMYDQMSASEASFSLVRDNPGITANNASRLLQEYGHKSTSTQSLLYAMIRQNMVRSVDGMLYTVAPKYIPLRKAEKAEKEKPSSKQHQGIAALKPQPTVETPPPPPPAPAPAPAPAQPAELDIDAIVKSLTIHQFLALRKKLNDLWRDA
jgi:hypothetical protein